MRLEYEQLRDQLREGEPPAGEFRLPLDPALTQLLEAAAATATLNEPLTQAQLAARLAG